MTTWVDVSDLLDFARTAHAVTGVQRVVAEVTPLLMDQRAVPVRLDSATGGLVRVGEPGLLAEGLRRTSVWDRARVTAEAQGEVARVGVPVRPAAGDTLVLLGTPWVNEGVLLAARAAHARGCGIVGFLYDLSPLRPGAHDPGAATPFRRCLHLLADTASVVVCISEATSREFTRYCADQGLREPPTVASGLPPGVIPDPAHGAEPIADALPGEDPYVLFVGTIEPRKNHAVAFDAWEILARDASPPRLVCVGRWGWGTESLRARFDADASLQEMIQIRDEGVTDAELAGLYAGALGTIYPSAYEGWGLPVSEALAFGKATITTDTSSLPESGEGLAAVVPVGDALALAAAVRDNLLDPRRRLELETRILESPAHIRPRTWSDVTATVQHAIERAETDRVEEALVEITAGHEYTLGVPATAASDATTPRVEAVVLRRGTPLLGDPIAADDVFASDALIAGDFAEPTTWGYPAPLGAHIDIRFRCPVPSPLILLVVTAPIVGSGTVRISGETETERSFAYGEAIAIDIPAGDVGGTVVIGIEVIGQDRAEGLPLTLQSVIAFNASDPRARIAVLERLARAIAVQRDEAEHTASALREQLSGVLGSMSWRITAPLRRITDQ